MVLGATEFLTSKTQNIQRRPIYTDIPYQTAGNGSQLVNPNFNYRRFWDWFKTRPEMVAVINILATDIIGDRPQFVDEDGKQLPAKKRRKAERFWRDNRMRESVKAILMDMFVTGDGYGWIGKLSEKERMNKVKEIVDYYSKTYSIKESTKSELFIKATQDEDLKKPRDFDYVASSSMNIIHNRQDIEGYIQKANGVDIPYKVDEIIHFRLNTIDGRVQGFAPMEALSAELILLYMIKQNMIAFFQNGGTPSKVFVLPEELAASDNHKFLVQTLQRYNAVENRNGNLVFTGNVDIKDLTSTPKDMEYKDLALYVVSNIALAYNIPVNRIPYLIGSSATGGDSGGLSESGYWNMISEKQDLIEDLLNAQLFESLGWAIKLNRKYKQDEVREAQTASMNADTVQKKQAIYRAQGKQLTVERVRELLGESDDDLEELEERPNEMEKTGLMNRNLLDNQSVEKEPDNRKRASTKREVANNNLNKDVAV